jgi:hypothetical protein
MVREGVSRATIWILVLLVFFLIGVPLALTVVSPGYLLVDLRVAAAVIVLVVSALVGWRIARRMGR